MELTDSLSSFPTSSSQLFISLSISANLLVINGRLAKVTIIMSIGIKGAGEEILEQHPRLDKLAETLEEIAGQWNGDESGSQEDMAHAANDAIEKIQELKELLEELNLTY